MGTVLHPPPSPTLPSRRPAVLVVVAAVVAAAALWFVTQRLAPSARFVDRVVVINPTPYQLQVDVSSASGGPGVSLGTVLRGQTTTFEDILDQGDEWIVHFRAAHYDGGEVRMSKADLARGDWKITVPSAVSDRLAAAGAPPSAGQ